MSYFAGYRIAGVSSSQRNPDDPGFTAIHSGSPQPGRDGEPARDIHYTFHGFQCFWIFRRFAFFPQPDSGVIDSPSRRRDRRVFRRALGAAVEPEGVISFMAEKTEKTVFLCSHCGAEHPKWQGKCPTCGEWGSVVEHRAAAGGSRARRGQRSPPPARITEIRTEQETRLATGFEEVDRVLGGGLVTDSAVLIGGEPGIGKSTLMTMLGYRLARTGHTVLYITGEESLSQVRLRAERLEALDERFWLAAETDLHTLLGHVEQTAPSVCIVDSIQTVHCPEVNGGPGTVTQVRETAGRLVACTKAHGIALLLVGHVTKDGSLAGPRTLEHLVDVVLSFDGDRHHAFRLLRGLKNRFGAADEVAVMEMDDRGLHEVTNPSVLFLRGRSQDEPGSVVSPAIIGTRTFLVEVQALAVSAAYGAPRRIISGLDTRRAQLVLAILERRGGFNLSAQDVYMNVVGGIQVEEPAADLAMALALASTLAEQAVPGDTVVLGELGLMGEIRSVPRIPARLSEAARLGFTRALVPADGMDRPPRVPGLEITTVSHLTEALEVAHVVA